MTQPITPDTANQPIMLTTRRPNQRHQAMRAVGRVWGDGSYIYVETPYRFRETCKSIPGWSWNKPKAGVWNYPFTAAAARNIVQAFARVDLDFDTSIWHLLEEYEHRVQIKDASDLPDVPRTKHAAWHHQRQAFWFGKDLPATMYALDMGTGKSKVAIDLIVNNDWQRTLIICPNNVVGVWPSEFIIHSAKDDIIVLPLNRGSVAHKVRAAESAWEDAKRSRKPLVVVINYESAWRSPFGPTYDSKNNRYKKDGFALSHAWDCVILDESQKIKAPGGRASTFCGKLREQASHRLCLTGTPMPHSPLDVYAQYRFLDSSIFGNSFVAFRNKYARMGGYMNKQVTGFQNLDDLNERFFSIGFRVGKEVLGLLDPVHVTKTIDLSPKAAGVYKEMEEEYVAEIDDGELVASNALVKLLRLQQITSGMVKDDEGIEHEVDTGKRDLLLDIVDDLQHFDMETQHVVREPVVVFCRFQHDLDSVQWVSEQLGWRYGEISGRRKDGLNERSKMSEDCDIIGVQIQSGGVGIDLTRACYAIYYSVGFSLGEYDQSLSRVHRPGQTRQVTYIHITANGTIDETVYDALQARKDVVDYTLIELSKKTKAGVSAGNDTDNDE